MTTVTNNPLSRFIRDDFMNADVKSRDFADAMRLKDKGAGNEQKIKTVAGDFLKEMFGRTKDKPEADGAARELAGDKAWNADPGTEPGDMSDVVFLSESVVAVDDPDDTVFVTTGDPIDEDGAARDEEDAALDGPESPEGTNFSLIRNIDNHSGSPSYANRREREADANRVFDQQLNLTRDALDLEHHDHIPASPVYPDIGRSLTGPRGQISWGGLHDKVARSAGDGWLELEELTSLGLSNSAARAILGGEQAISASVLMDTFASEAKLRGGMPVSITDFGIDQAMSALIHADGPLRGNFDDFAPDGFITKEDFIQLATEAAAYMNEPAPSRRSISQLFDEIAGGDRRLSEFAFNNVIAPTNADGSFDFEDVGLSIVEQLAMLGPPLTDRWLDADRNTNSWRNSHGRPAYAFGSSNSIRLGEFRQGAANAMDWTGEYVSPKRVNEAYQTISSWDGRSGISPAESRWAFGSNPSAWDIIEGIRSNSTPSWTARWDAPRHDSTSWWRSGW